MNVFQPLNRQVPKVRILLVYGTILCRISFPAE
jgi:hypothetical protein